MPGKHDTNKFKLVGCYVDVDFLADIDSVRGERGRSQFLRDALQEKLEAAGVTVLRDKVVAPDRAGKGGRKAVPVSFLRTKKLREPKP